MNTKSLRPGLAYGLSVGIILVVSAWFMGDLFGQFNATTNVLLLLTGSVYAVGLARFIKSKREKLFPELQTPQEPAQSQQATSQLEL